MLIGNVAPVPLEHTVSLTATDLVVSGSQGLELFLADDFILGWQVLKLHATHHTTQLVYYSIIQIQAAFTSFSDSK